MKRCMIVTILAALALAVLAFEFGAPFAHPQPDAAVAPLEFDITEEDVP